MFLEVFYFAQNAKQISIKWCFSDDYSPHQIDHVKFFDPSNRLLPRVNSDGLEI